MQTFWYLSNDEVVISGAPGLCGRYLGTVDLSQGELEMLLTLADQAGGAGGVAPIDDTLRITRGSELLNNRLTRLRGLVPEL